uniref:Uncharacterized protein n=1 Tax=Arundo donax TaxID=35708 RepID=A0A0A9F0I0_ARUDO
MRSPATMSVNIWTNNVKQRQDLHHRRHAISVTCYQYYKLYILGRVNSYYLVTVQQRGIKNKELVFAGFLSKIFFPVLYCHEQ